MTNRSKIRIKSLAAANYGMLDVKFRSSGENICIQSANF